MDRMKKKHPVIDLIHEANKKQETCIFFHGSYEITSSLRRYT